ncbi:MAG: putative lipoprotein, partial [Phycisphaerales bacterium]|nr:putative lipoprotein [Phycisphaerales bacterium]
HRSHDAATEVADSSRGSVRFHAKNPRLPSRRPRFSCSTKFLAIGIVALIGITGCVPKPLLRPAYYGPTDSLPTLVDKLNARNDRITTLWAKGTFSADLIDPQTKDHTGGDGDLNLLFSKPGKLRLAGKAFGTRLFDIGSNDEQYWMVLPQQDTMYVGTHAAIANGGASKLPIRPDLLVEVLGVTPLQTDLLKEPAPTLRFNNDQDCYMVTWQVLMRDRFAVQKEVWYDRQSLQPRLVLLFDANGRVVLRAYPSQPMKVDGYDPLLELPTTYDLLFPDTGSTFVIRLRELEHDRDGAPNAATFAYPGDRAKVSKVVNLDR